MFSWIAYHFLIYPVSLLPLPVLYFFTDGFYLLLISVLPYRRGVVRSNLERSFPEKSNKERRKIERRFYRHLTNLLAEGAKNLSISKKQLLRRFQVENPEIMEDLHAEKKSVLLVSGHYNNWEWLISSQDLLFPHRAVGIGMPLSNGFWDHKLNERRARFGMDIIHAKIVNEYFKNNDALTATLVLADQSPGSSKKCYWTTFLNQDTGVFFGPELLANKYDAAVVFFSIHQKRRGKYVMRLEEITREPRELEWGTITEAHTQLLEAAIRKQPEFWLWSHKRWKREVPDDLEALRNEQRSKFESKFRTS